MNHLSPRFAIEDIAEEHFKELILLLVDPDSELGLSTNDITTVTKINGVDIVGRNVCKQIVAYIKKGSKHVALSDSFHVNINFECDMEAMEVFIYEAKKYIVGDADSEFFDKGGDKYYGDGGNEFDSDDMSDEEYLDMFRDDDDDDW